MRTQRVESTLEFAGKLFSFIYPNPQNPSSSEAVIREGKAATFIPGSMLDEFPSRTHAFDAAARHFGLMNGDPTLSWIESCFTCVRAHRVSMGIKKSIETAAAAYKSKVHLRTNKAPFGRPIRTKINSPRGNFPKAKRGKA